MVLTAEDQSARMAFQQVEEQARSTWPEPGVAQQLHLDLTVATAEGINCGLTGCSVGTNDDDRHAAPYHGADSRYREQLGWPERCTRWRAAACGGLPPTPHPHQPLAISPSLIHWVHPLLLSTIRIVLIIQG